MKYSSLLILFVMSAFILKAQRNSDYQKAEEWKHSGGSIYSVPKNVEWQNSYDQRFVHIDVEVHDTSNYISGNVKYNATCTGSTMTELKFQLVPELIIDSVLIDGINSVFTRLAEITTVTLPSSILPAQDFIWQVYYHGTPINPVEYRGLFHIVDDFYLQDVTYTLSEPFHLKEWLPCKEDLTDKLDSAWTFITTDTSCMAGSNGLLAQVTPVNSSLHRFEWKTRYPIDFYLLSLNVSDYMEYDLYAHPAGYPDSILVQNYLFDNPTALLYWQSDLNKTPGMIELYSELYGLYPFRQEKYGHCQVKLPGAMEHQTMTTSGVYWDWVIAHELSHQWFGDYVTCATWQDIFVNEGWATYSEFLFYEDKNDTISMGLWTGQTYFQAKQEPLGSVYIPFADAGDENRIFSWNLSYKKGGAILRMLRYLINNDSLFFSGVREYVVQYANSNATGEDFKNMMESITGIDLQQYFDEWFYGQGFPIFDVTWNSQYGTPNTFNVDLAVEGTSPANNFFSLPIPIKLNLDNGNDTTVFVVPSGSTDNYSFSTGTTLCQSVEFDPEDFIVDSLRSLSHSVPPLQQEVPVKMYYSGSDDILNIVVMQTWLLPIDISIVTADGKTIYSGKITESHTAIPMSGLAGAVYSARLENTAIHYQTKFVKTR